MGILRCPGTGILQDLFLDLVCELNVIRDIAFKVYHLGVCERVLLQINLCCCNLDILSLHYNYNRAFVNLISDLLEKPVNND